MPSDTELNTKLTELLRVMVSRLPPNKKLTTAVVMQLLRTKYGDTYSEAYVSGHEQFITDAILKLSIEKEKAALAAVGNKHAASSSSSSAISDNESDDDGEDDSDAESGSGADDTEDEEASADSDDDDEEEEDEEEDLYSESGDDDTSNDEPDHKKARAEEIDAISKKEKELQQQTAVDAPQHNSSTTVSLGERCKAMAECLRKLSYRVRAPNEEESLEAYLENFLIAEFQKHDMDPEKYSKSDVKRYRIKREVELLQQDGASLSLDRRNRAGRGFSNINLVSQGNGASAAAADAPPKAAKQTSMFLDDE